MQQQPEGEIRCPWVNRGTRPAGWSSAPGGDTVHRSAGSVHQLDRANSRLIGRLTAHDYSPTLDVTVEHHRGGTDRLKASIQGSRAFTQVTHRLKVVRDEDNSDATLLELRMCWMQRS